MLLKTFIYKYCRMNKNTRFAKGDELANAISHLVGHL